MLVLTGCGGGGQSDSPPPAPLRLSVVPEAGTPAGTVNSSNVTAVSFEMEFGEGSRAFDRVTIWATDELGQTLEMNGFATQGAGTSIIGPMNMTSMADGQVAMSGEARNGNGSTGVMAFESLVKDTDGFSTPVSAYVSLAQPGEARDDDTERNIINLTNDGSTTVAVVFPTDATLGINAVVTLSDGTNSVSTVPVGAGDGGGEVFTRGVDTSTLMEGSITLSVEVRDTAGNVNTFPGSNALKDVTVPAPVSVSFPASDDNPEGYVNLMTSTVALARAQFSPDMGKGDVVSLLISDGSIEYRTPTRSVDDRGYAPELTSAGPVFDFDFAGLDLTRLQDGPLSVTASVADAHGNRVDFTMTPVFKDTIVGDPLTAVVAAGTDNAQGLVNQASQSSARIDVTLPSKVEVGDTVTITLQDGSGGSVAATAPVLTQGSVSFPALDLTTLADGPLTLLAVAEDTAGNVSGPGTGTALKGTSSPLSPIAVRVPATSLNPTNVVNQDSQFAAGIEVDLSGASDSAATLHVDATLGAVTVSGTQANPMGSLAAFSLDLSTLPDGTFALQAYFVDAFGNQSASVTASPLKDTVAPGAPASAIIEAGTKNSQGYVSAGSETEVAARVKFPGSYDGTESVTVNLLTPPSTRTPTLPALVPAGGGEVIVSGIDATSLPDGAFLVEVFAQDVNGNAASYALAGGTKDTVAPQPPITLGVAMGPNNPADTINGLSETSVRVAVSYATATDPGVTAIVTLTDPALRSLSTPESDVPPGGGAAELGPIDTSTLLDGPISVAMLLADAAGNQTMHSGTVATKDTTGPDAPTSAGVAAGANNGAHIINTWNETAVQIDVEFGPNSLAADAVTITMMRGGSMLVSGPLPAPNGAGTLSFTGLDVSAFDDGSVSMKVDISDTFGNVTSFVGTSALKDTVAPEAYTSAHIQATAQSPVDFINGFNMSAPRLEVVFPGSYDGTEVVQVSLTDGIATVVATPTAIPAGGGAQVFTLPSVAALADGPITVSVYVSDIAGNEATYANGMNATKDTTGPADPISVRIPAGMNNPADVINNQTHASVDVEVVYDASMTGTETATLMINGSGVPLGDGATVGPIPVPVGGGAFTFAGIDLRGTPDGTVEMTLLIQDPAGNEGGTDGTPALKDTQGPALPSGAGVTAGMTNAAGIINLSNVGGVSVDVTFGSESASSDTVTVTLLSGDVFVTSGSQNAPAGAGTLSFLGLNASMLTDGKVTVQVDLMDQNQSLSSFSGTPALKDTVVPDAYTNAHVQKGNSNDQDLVNSTNVGTAAVSVVFPASYDGSETASVTLTDTAFTTVSSSPQSPPFGGGEITFAMPSLAPLLDGTLTLSVAVADGVGNATTYSLGTNAIKDTTLPASPSFVRVPASASNPADVVNNQTETAVLVEIGYDPSMEGDETATLTFESSLGQIVTRSGLAVPLGGGTISVGGNDLSGLSDGPVTLMIEIRDPVGNTAAFDGTPFLKDTVAPSAPITAIIPGATSNPEGFINSSNVNAFVVDVTWGDDADPSATAVVTVVDATNPVTSMGMAPTVAGVVSYTGLDGTALSEGSHQVRVDITDASLNLTTFMGSTATKDTVAPTAPSVLQIAGGPNNDPNVINIASMDVGGRIDVTYDPSMVGDEVVTIRISSGATEVTLTPSAPAGGGATSISPVGFDALADGTSVMLEMTLTDLAGNSTIFLSPVTAIKDTVAPELPTAAYVADTGGNLNPDNVINGASATNARVEVQLSGGEIGDNASVTFTSAGTTISSPVITLVSQGDVTLSFAGNDVSTLPDGTVAISVLIEDPARNGTMFVGTPATKDSLPPDAPTFAGIAETANNPASFVNGITAGAVEVLITFGPTSLGTDIVTLIIEDQAMNSMSYGPTNPTVGAGNLRFVNQDFSGLLDGTLTVTVNMSDPAGNIVSYQGNSAVKDTVPPTAPTGFVIAAGTQNAVDVVNSLSAMTVQLDVTYGAATVGDETVTLVIASSGGGQFTLTPSAPPVGGGLVSYSPVDLLGAGLQDGALTLSGTFMDPAGNVSPFGGNPAVMATKPPDTPVTAFVAADAQNTDNVINMFNEGAVSVDMTFSSHDPTDQVTVSLVDELGALVSSGPLAAAPALSFTGIDASGLKEGAILVRIDVLDQYGNPPSVGNGTPAWKDVTPPAAPSLVEISAGPGNSKDWVSAASAASAIVQVEVPSSYTGVETIDLSVSDGLNPPIMAPTQAAVSGGGHLPFSLDLSSLQDGPLSLTVVVMDEYGNMLQSITNANKDTVAPTGVIDAMVAATANNPAGYINSSSQLSVVVDVMYDGTADVNDSVVVTLTDFWSQTRSSASTPAVVGGTASTAPFGAGILLEGPITITLALTDLAGNTGVATGTTAQKDITAPPAPVVDPLTAPTNEIVVNITGVAELDNLVTVNGAPNQGTGVANLLGSFVVPFTAPTDTTTNLTVISTDPAGNVSATRTTDWLGQTLALDQDSAAPDVPFSDRSTIAGVDGTGPVAGGSFVDIDLDGDLDLFVGETGQLYRNDGSGVFTDITVAAGSIITSDQAAVWADYDNDGDLDLFTTHSTLGSFLYQNDIIGLGTMTFSDATIGSGASISGDLRGAAWFDYNMDGFVDIMSADADGFGNELLRNDGTMTFTGIFGSGLDPTAGSPQWTAVGDLNGDGLIDVVIGDASPGLLYINTGSGFTNTAGALASGFVTDTSTTGGGIALGDVDNDGDLDIFVASGGAGGTNQLWINDGMGNFNDASNAAGIQAAVGAYDVVFGDFDNDGRLDIYLACNGPNVLLLNQGDMVGGDGIPEFVNVAGQVGSLVNDAADGRLVVAGDIDGDGDVDVFVGNATTSNVLFRNDTDNFNFMKVRVFGKGGAQNGCSLDAIGTRVVLQDMATGADLGFRWVGGGRGAGADDPKILHFGGAIPSRPYNVRVEFPNGTVQTVSGVVPALLSQQTLTVLEQ